MAEEREAEACADGAAARVEMLGMADSAEGSFDGETENLRDGDEICFGV